MLVDDSAAIRAAERRLLESEPNITIVASVGNGQQAIDALKRNAVEVVVLDIEMPVMDGMTALPKLLAVDPDIKIVMASTLTLAGAEISMQALALGAADYLPKPTNVGSMGGASEFKRGLVEKILALGRARRRRQGLPGAAGAKPGAVRPAPAPQPIALRTPGIKPAEVLVIGSSTGGPQALLKLMGDLKTNVRLPILITQHMPPTFTSILAQHISKASGLPAAEGKDGQVIEGGHIYVAPGNYHMLVEKQGQGRNRVIRLKQTPPENFCRPAVDPMLRSLAEAYDGKLLVVILTGMGQDGMLGAKVAVEAGATVLAQDEASSVVWGMPGAVATAGLASAVLPLDRIAKKVLDSIGGPRK